MLGPIRHAREASPGQRPIEDRSEVRVARVDRPRGAVSAGFRRPAMAKATRRGTPATRKGSANPRPSANARGVVATPSARPRRRPCHSQAPATTSRAQTPTSAQPSTLKCPAESCSNGPPTSDRKPHGVIGNSPRRRRWSRVIAVPIPNPSPRMMYMMAAARTASGTRAGVCATTIYPAPSMSAGAVVGLDSRIDLSRARFATTSRPSTRATSGSATDMILETSSSIVAVR